ncbi:MAG: efflux RND transporter periplasmic adaptor subunit [Bacteroidia bacterium]
MESSNVFIRLFSVGVILAFMSCNHKSDKINDAIIDAHTPISITNISVGPMVEYIELNATSAFLQRSYVKANTNGYLTSATISLGSFVKKRDILFILKTKEAHSIGNSLTNLDSTLNFSGLLTIKANEEGYITQISHQAGDYVLDGESLAVIGNMNSLVFLLDLPYELKPYIVNQKSVDVILPDGEKLKGTIANSMPTVDAVSQTQSIVINVNTSHLIPENLIAKIRIIKSAKANSITLPKAAVLTDETQQNFWIMKMLNDSTAVKIPIVKGIETQDKVEIISPQFSVSDKIVVNGNYGLSDTALVKIVQ